MALHLLKLCVGCDSVSDLERWIAQKTKASGKGEPRQHVHRTRMMPKRGAELLDSGSLYWVIRGEIMCRQRLLALRPMIDGEGVRCCGLVLEPAVTRVEPRAHRAFQGWRYLLDKEVPPDLDRTAAGARDMPEQMRRTLRDLGLL